MAAQKLSGPVGERIAARDDWQALQEAVDVFTELFHRHVAAHGILAQRHENDPVEIAAQPLDEAFGELGIARIFRWRTQNSDAGTLRLVLANGLEHPRKR